VIHLDERRQKMTVIKVEVERSSGSASPLMTRSIWRIDIIRRFIMKTQRGYYTGTVSEMKIKASRLF
jgi:hypothetical protein